MRLYKIAEAFRAGNPPEPSPNFDFEAERQNRPPRFLDIVTDYAAGHTVNSIIEKYKCSKGTVLRYARLAGPPKREKHFDNSIRSQAIDLLKSGAPIKSISSMLNVSEAYVSIVAKASGLSRYKQK